jgi:phospholipid/cholesterol/gamma-HCH transport system ATP-binding protein
MITFNHVHKSFGSKIVLNDLSMHIPRGKISFILGKSGEGKSVTIKHIMGLMKPDQGEIFVDGTDITHFDEEMVREHRKRFGMLFQHAALFDSLSVFNNVAFPLREQRHPPNPAKIQERVMEVLEAVELADVRQKMPSQLSTGEKKRVGLARALAAHPEVILYDEPTTGMDPLISEMIDELIVKVGHDNADLTSVVISHDLKAALATGENIIMLYKGKVELAGTAEDFRASSSPIIRQFFSGRVDGPMEFL